MHEQLAILAVFVFLYSLIAGRVGRSLLSGPIIFVSVGFLLGPMVLGWFPGDEPRNTLRTLADLTLALFLFTDAANANLATLRRKAGIPARMLLIGLPGSIALGSVLAFFMFDMLTLFEAAMLGTMLAATDAALGQAVVTNPAVPDRLREGLNVESGLNDGLCVPILFVFIALELGSESGSEGALVAKLLVQELGVGTLVGLVVAGLGYLLLGQFKKLGWLDPIWTQISSMALAIACFGIAQSIHASGYIAAFVGGMLFGYLAKDQTEKFVHSTEGIADVLALLTWFLFGYAVIGQVFGAFSWPIVLYALLSLTVVRMLPVYLSMTGSGESPQSRLFLGWFGPRGLASLVFAIIILDADLPGSKIMALVVVCTIFLSLILHGITANPLSNWISSTPGVKSENRGSE